MQNCQLVFHGVERLATPAGAVGVGVDVLPGSGLLAPRMASILAQILSAGPSFMDMAVIR